MAQLASLLVPIGELPKPDTSWIDNIAKSLGGVIDQASENKSFNTLADRIGGAPAPAQQQGGFLSRLMGGNQQASQQPLTAPVGAVDRGPTQGSTFAPFIETVKQSGVTNPYALSAIAATGRAESGWSPQNANRAWADPSQSGQAGTAGGIMSWRNERLHNLKQFAQANGEDPNNISPQTQAKFFVQEDPQLISRLNSARSPQEAADIMAGAWKFAGYDQQGGEAGRRRALAQNYYAQQFQNEAPPQAAPQQAAGNIVASLDPSIGIPMPGAAGQMRANDPAQVAPPGQTAGYVDPQIATAPQQQPLMQPQAPIQTGAPQQVADNGPTMLAQGITPIQRGGVDPAMIQFMLRDPNLRQAGLQLWQQNATGKTSEPWQFVTLPDGTLARANQQTGAIEKVGQFAKPQDPISVSEGETLLDPVTKQPIYTGKPKTPASYQEFQLAKEGGFQGTYADWEKVKVPGGVTVNNAAAEGATAKAAGEGLGKLFAGIFDEGLASKQDKANVSLLRSTLANSPDGVLGGLASIASDYGVNLGPNADQVQVAKSVIAKMVPAQRVPGSGTTSDRDLTMFQNALPRLSGTAEGNSVILDTLDSLADFKSAQADIVTQFYAGDIDQKQAVKALQALPDPFTAYKSFAGQNGGDVKIGMPTPKTDAEFNALPSGTIYIDPDDNKKYRKP